MTGFDSKRSAAQDTLDDEADTLTIVYQRGFADGKRAAQRKQLTGEPQSLEERHTAEKRDRQNAAQRPPMKAADEFELHRLLAEERYTVRQLSRALREQVESPTFMGEPLITHTTPPAAQPKQRKPLTANEILNLMPSSIPAEYDGALMEFARAIEAAHKIKEGT